MRRLIPLSVLPALLLGALVLPVSASATDTLRGVVVGDPVAKIEMGIRRIGASKTKISSLRVKRAPYPCDNGTIERFGFSFRHGHLRVNRKGHFDGHVTGNPATQISGRVREAGSKDQQLLATGRIEDTRIGQGTSICRGSFRFQVASRGR
jgi:hypothetical protein